MRETLSLSRAECSSQFCSVLFSSLCCSLCSLIYQRILSFFNFCCCCFGCCLVHLFAHRWPPKCGTSFAFKMFSPAQFQPAQLWPFIWHISLCLPIAAAVARPALSGSSGSPQCLFVFAKLMFLLLFLLFLFSPSLSLFLYRFRLQLQWWVRNVGLQSPLLGLCILQAIKLYLRYLMKWARFKLLRHTSGIKRSNIKIKAKRTGTF